MCVRNIHPPPVVDCRVFPTTNDDDDDDDDDANGGGGDENEDDDAIPASKDASPGVPRGNNRAACSDSANCILLCK